MAGLIVTEQIIQHEHHSHIHNEEYLLQPLSEKTEMVFQSPIREILLTTIRDEEISVKSENIHISTLPHSFEMNRINSPLYSGQNLIDLMFLPIHDTTLTLDEKLVLSQTEDFRNSYKKIISMFNDNFGLKIFKEQVTVSYDNNIHKTLEARFSYYKTEIPKITLIVDNYHLLNIV